MPNIIKLALLGATGSIGAQTMDILRRHPDRFQLTAISAGRHPEPLYNLIREFHPAHAALLIEPADIPADIKHFTTWHFGQEANAELVRASDCDSVLDAIVGMAGLSAVLAAIDCGKRILLANKEALVAGGALVMAAARAKGVDILPVDSEHSAIFQCLQGHTNEVSRLLITASGGPFRTWNAAEIAAATVDQALNHPVWRMGGKVTIDSASLMNKGLEVIEARWLFDMPPEQIEVLVHPQSIVHSLVEFTDGAVLAQLGEPDMRVPIEYALAYPERVSTGVKRLELAGKPLSFEAPDMDKFRCLRLAYDALHAGGTACAVLNAADEVAVAAFLNARIPFGGIADVNEETLNRMPVEAPIDYANLLEVCARAKAIARELCISKK